MNIKILIEDFFKIDRENNGVAIKTDFSNINLDGSTAEFVINDESEWRFFFEELNRRISDFAMLFYVKSEKSNLEEIAKNFKPEINIEIENKKDLKRLEALCLILKTRMLFIKGLNKSNMNLEYLTYESKTLSNPKVSEYPLIFGLVKLLSICHRLMKNDEIFVDKKYNDIFKNYKISTENDVIFESKYMIFKDGKVIKYLLDNKIENVFYFISFNLIEKAIFDDKKVDVIINLMTLINIDLNVDEYFDSVMGIIGTKNYLEKLFKEKEYYVVFCDLSTIEFYKIGQDFILTENGKHYSVKDSTFNLLLNKRIEDTNGGLLTFDIKTMSSKSTKIIEKNRLIEILKSKSDDINKSLQNLAA